MEYEDLELLSGAELLLLLLLKACNRLESTYARVKVACKETACRVRRPRFRLARVLQEHLATRLLNACVVSQVHLQLAQVAQHRLVGGVELESLQIGAPRLIIRLVLAVQDAHHVPARKVSHVLEQHLFYLCVRLVATSLTRENERMHREAF